MANAAPRTGTPRSVLSVWQTLPMARWGTLALVLGVYAIASLEPFDWQIPRQVANHAERTRDGWSFAAPGIVIAEPPHDWLDAARAAETFTLSLVVRSRSAAQSGPARIVTMSWDTHMRNLTLHWLQSWRNTRRTLPGYALITSSTVSLAFEQYGH